MGETYNNAVSMISEWNSNNVTPTPEREWWRTVQSIETIFSSAGDESFGIIFHGGWSMEIFLVMDSWGCVDLYSFFLWFFSFKQGVICLLQLLVIKVFTVWQI